MNIVFMGTPDFSVPTLEYMVREGYNVVCAVTQPDKPRGRGNKVSYCAVKEKAIELGIPVLQPSNIKKDREFIESLKNMGPDVMVVVAFGQILSKEILEIPRLGCINVHGSLLPHLRGAAPINWSIINGDEMTGVTTMFMDVGLDTGDMLLKEPLPIGPDETAGELHDRMKITGAEVLIRTLKALESGSLERIPQDDSKSSYAPMLDKDTGRINWNSPGIHIKNLVRGTNPWPAAFSFLNEKKLKIWRIEPDPGVKVSGKSGQVFKVDKNGIYVYCGDGAIILKEVQEEGGKRMDAHSYTLGHPLEIGCVFE